MTIAFFMLSLSGTFLNMFHKKEGFICWGFSNLFWGLYMLGEGEYVMALQFGIYLALSIYSYFYWGRDEAK